jgi:hypothetical protein
MKLSELRKELKAIGFKVTTKSLSFGKYATFTNMDGHTMPSIFFGEEHRLKWFPLIDYRTVNHERLVELTISDSIRGLTI